MAACLRSAGLEPREVDYINAHAPGTDRGDAAEAEAVARVVGNAAVKISSTKALHGHALGAGGALELIATILGLEERWAPAMPCAAADPAIPLTLVTGAPAALDGDVALSNSFGFGGLNASIIVRRDASNVRRDASNVRRDASNVRRDP
jgi:3-oxoacyl-[acyl-carrier-protein] synthase II